MTDRDRDEIIISLSEIAKQPTDDGMVDGVNQQMIRDALELLKEKKAIKPDYDPVTLTWSCGNCGQTFDRCKYKFCQRCGQAIKWDE